MNRSVVEDDPRGSMDAPEFSASESRDNEDIIVPDGDSSSQGNQRQPPPQNLASERLRKENAQIKKQMEQLQTQVQEYSGDRERLSRLNSFLDAVSGDKPAGNQQAKLDLSKAPDPIEDPDGFRQYQQKYIQQEIQAGVQQGVNQGLNSFKTEQSQQQRISEINRMNREATQSFYQSDKGKVIAQGGQQDEFKEFVGNHWYGSGYNGALTPEDLNRAYFAFRQEDAVVEAQRAGQRQVVNAFQNGASAQRPKAVAQSTSIENMSPIDLAQELVGLSQNDVEGALRIFDSLSSEKKRAVLPYLPDSAN